MIIKILITLLSLTLLNHARLGETKKECQKRYGFSKTTQLGREVFVEYKNYELMLTFADDDCVCIIIARADKKPLDNEEIITLLNKNIGKDDYNVAKWMALSKKKWKSTITNHEAFLVGKGEGLIIYNEFFDPSKKDNGAKDLNGF